MNREGMIAVCIGALALTPVAMWLHVWLSKLAERPMVIGWLATATFLIAWLAAITFVITGLLLVAALFLPTR